MKIDRVKFSKHFHPTNPGEWIGFEGQLEDGDDPIKAAQGLRELADAAYRSQSSEKNEPVISVERSIGLTVKDIESIKSLSVLKEFKLLIEKKFPHLEPAYTKRYKDLFEKEKK